MSNRNVSFSTALAAAFADNGVTAACISPGSRNTPLIIGFAAEDRIEKWPILDERSAAFFALGLARATDNPVVLVCTSGTAAAEYHAAVVEARQSNVPLIVLTADRPPELRGIGSPQTIDQISLYGSSPILFRDVPPPDDGASDPLEIAAEAVTVAATLPRGPVHLNLPFREPLLSPEKIAHPQRHASIHHPRTEQVHLGDWVDDIAGRRGLIIAGRSFDPSFPGAAAALADATGFPVLADPLAGIRHGRHAQDLVLGYGDALAAAGALDRHTPDVIIRLGPIPTSKPICRWLETHPATKQFLAEASGQDATRSATVTITASPSVFAEAVTSRIAKAAPEDWTAAWKSRDQAAGEAIRRVIDQAPFPNEPAIARIVIEHCPAETLLTIGSSMPIRDVDAYGGATARALRLFGNRGANGIDGVVSSALGAAASGSPSVALVGDVSMFHDLNALGTMTQLGLPLTIVVVNNDGGGIFHLLPQADSALMAPDTFETFLGTPHGTDFTDAGRALGVESDLVDTKERLATALSVPTAGPRLLELRTDRKHNLELHRSIAAAVRDSF